jgi:hypothetical protein
VNEGDEDFGEDGVDNEEDALAMRSKTTKANLYREVYAVAYEQNQVTTLERR